MKDSRVIVGKMMLVCRKYVWSMKAIWRGYDDGWEVPSLVCTNYAESIQKVCREYAEIV